MPGIADDQFAANGVPRESRGYQSCMVEVGTYLLRTGGADCRSTSFSHHGSKHLYRPCQLLKIGTHVSCSFPVQRFLQSWGFPRRFPAFEGKSGIAPHEPRGGRDSTISNFLRFLPLNGHHMREGLKIRVKDRRRWPDLAALSRNDLVDYKQKPFGFEKRKQRKQECR